MTGPGENAGRSLGGQHHAAASGGLRVPRAPVAAGRTSLVPGSPGPALAALTQGAARPQAPQHHRQSAALTPEARRPAVLLRRCTIGTRANWHRRHTATGPRIESCVSQGQVEKTPTSDHRKIDDSGKVTK